MNNPDEYEVNPKWMEELKSVFNRGFDTGFYFNVPYETSETNQSKYIKKDIGQVVNFYNKVSVAELRVWDDLKIGVLSASVFPILLVVVNILLKKSTRK